MRKQLKRAATALLALLLLPACSHTTVLQVESSEHDLAYDSLPARWDEAHYLGNAFIGELVWKRDSALRLSLDRIDLWDLHPSDSLKGENFKYRWVYDQWKKGDYQPVHDKMDTPYDRNAAPSKLPGAALEFDITALGEVSHSALRIKQGVTEVSWASGASFTSFVDATQSSAWFLFKNVPEGFEPTLIPPRYQLEGDLGESHPVSGHDLRRLGYTQGKVTREGNTIRYHQVAYNDFTYDVVVTFERKGADLLGAWSITSSLSESLDGKKAETLVAEALQKGIDSAYSDHCAWWKNYWAASSISLPDKVLEKQYYQEMYKYGSLTRENGYIIPLQGVWTADNGLLPPWKGDVHHDLNTQLSYWPTYKGNHLTLGTSYLNTLWNQRETNRRYTKAYFECEGIAVPGVATLLGEPMGGWIQYSLSPTVSGWLAQHFYLHWRYSMDSQFLAERGYPYVKDAATLFENITVKDEKTGKRALPISSSPEVYDNSPKAWFPTFTNYDLAIIRNTFLSAARMAEALGKTDEAAKWTRLESELPAWDLDSQSGLTFAKGKEYDESHRHFSHAMAIHPFSLLDVTKGEADTKIIGETLRKLDAVGPDYWCGYSYSWLGNMKARALDADGAVQALRTFAECFCLSNTFHANGDQTRSGKSRFVYRPFTLEGNMAFAAGVQELLLQSHTPVVRIFPAVPASWKEVSFEKLRAEGAFLISAKRVGGETTEVVIESEAGGELKLQNPFGTKALPKGMPAPDANGVITIPTTKGQSLVFACW